MAKPKRKAAQAGQPQLDLEATIAGAIGPEAIADGAPARGGLVPLTEDASSHRFLVYATVNSMRAELRHEGDTCWASQAQMGEMFGVTPQNVTMHLRNIFDAGELAEAAVCKESLHTGRDGKRYRTKLYDLNVIISVGYRVGSKQGTMFRIWATEKLFQILTKGFYVDKERLKNRGEPDVLDEFRDIAREIRTSIRNSYREVLRLCALCADYDGSNHVAREFFMEMENKLLWAAASKPAPQLILERCDVEHEALGLTYCAGRRGPTQRDVVIGNNYLAIGEAERKDRSTEMWWTYVEEQLDQGRLPTMGRCARSWLDSSSSISGHC